MDLVTLGRAFGLSFTSGINLYATTAIVGLAVRYDWVDLPEQFVFFDNDVLIYGSLAMYAIEFFADKIPWLDTAWDALHTFIRPLGGALIAVAAMGEAAPAIQGLVALLGGSVAASTHVAKAGSRAAVNTSPEPVTNSIASLLEDVIVVAMGFLAMIVPIVALVVALVALVVIWIFIARLARAARRRLRPRRSIEA